MRKFVVACCLCSSVFAVLPVIDVGLIAAIGVLQAAFSTFSASAKAHWNTQENFWSDERKQWQKDNEFYKSAIEKYKEILTAITQKKKSIDELNEKEKQTLKLLENIGNITKKVIDQRDLKALSDELGKDSKVISDDFKIKYCEKLKESKAKYICYADFGAAATSLILEKKSLDDVLKFNKAIEAIDDARKGSKDVKESADIANVIAQEHLELATYKAQKNAAQNALKEKKELEMLAAKKRALEKINSNFDMSKIVKKKEKK